MLEEIKYIDIGEFQRLGFLQEVNRLFFHPVGLALEVLRHEDGIVTLGGIWDYRDDPEGVMFGGEYIQGEVAVEKANSVAVEREKHRAARVAMFGDIIQRIPVD